MFAAIEKSRYKVTVLNLGTDEYCEVRESISWICAELGLRPELRFSGGDRGWVGDNPFIYLDTSAIRSLGWVPKLTIKEAVISTVRYLRSQGAS